MSLAAAQFLYLSVQSILIMLEIEEKLVLIATYDTVNIYMFNK